MTENTPNYPMNPADDGYPPFDGAPPEETYGGLNGMFFPPEEAVQAVPPAGDMDLAGVDARARASCRIRSVTAGELVKQSLPPLREYVSGMITEGLTILAGTPKSGKSWLSLSMACAVAEGKRFLGRETERAAVLYMGLEDSARRLKQRVMTVSPITPEGLYFDTDTIRLDDGLLKALEEWFQNVPSTGMVIIDTLGKVKSAAVPNSSAFTADYGEIAAVKALADRRHAAIVLLHHLRKRASSDGDNADPFEQISGTTGITAAADTMVILTRPRGSAYGKLVWTGRDVGDGETHMRFEAGRWSGLTGDEAARMVYEKLPAVGVVRAFMAQPGFSSQRTVSYDDLKAFAAANGMPIGLTSSGMCRELKNAQEGLLAYDRIAVAVDRRVGSKRGVTFMKLGGDA